MVFPAGTKVVCAAAVAAAVLAPASAGGSVRGHPALAPSGGPPVATTSQAGYVASGRDFRYASAMITVPDQRCVAEPGTPPAAPARPPLGESLYVGLDRSPLTGSHDFARAGVTCSVPVSTARWPAGWGHHPAGQALGRPGRMDGLRPWVGFFALDSPTLPAPVTDLLVLDGVKPGDGVLCTVYFNSAGRSVQFTLTLPGGTVYNTTLPVTGAGYTSAQALADWGDLTPVPPPATTRLTQFLAGRFTTASGQRGTFTGPWALTPWEATSNGFPPPSGTLIAQPARLWTDGSSLPGQAGDAFGVWLLAS